MSLLKGVGQQPEGSLPRAVQQVQGPVHPLPVGQVIEGIAGTEKLKLISKPLTT